MANSLRVVSIVAALGLATPALSQVPHEGPIDTTLCWGGPMHVITATPKDRFGAYMVKGGTSAADLRFDSMTVECVGTFEAGAAGMQSRGYCVFEDADGHKIHGGDVLARQTGYTWQYLGGTGKFEGITGSGTIERVGDLGPGPGTLRGCRRFVGSYKLPVTVSGAR